MGPPVPELYMQDVVSEDGSKKYIVVDGQQRITACLEFVTNQFQIDGDTTPSYAEMTFDDLSPEDKKESFQLLICCTAFARNVRP